MKMVPLVMQKIIVVCDSYSSDPCDVMMTSSPKVVPFLVKCRKIQGKLKLRHCKILQARD